MNEKTEISLKQIIGKQHIIYDDAPFSTNVKNRLINNKIFTIGQLFEFSKSELFYKCGFCFYTIRKIDQNLKYWFGFGLKED